MAKVFIGRNQNRLVLCSEMRPALTNPSLRAEILNLVFGRVKQKFDELSLGIVKQVNLGLYEFSRNAIR